MNREQLAQVIEGMQAIEEGMVTIEDAGGTKWVNCSSSDQRKFVTALKHMYFAYKRVVEIAGRLRKELDLPFAGEVGVEVEGSGGAGVEEVGASHVEGPE